MQTYGIVIFISFIYSIGLKNFNNEKLLPMVSSNWSEPWIRANPHKLTIEAVLK